MLKASFVAEVVGEFLMDLNDLLWKILLILAITLATLLTLEHLCRVWEKRCVDSPFAVVFCVAEVASAKTSFADSSFTTGQKLA